MRICARNKLKEKEVKILIRNTDIYELNIDNANNFV